MSKTASWWLIGLLTVNLILWILMILDKYGAI